jgi:tetratricopeptide (TPR) repeat protein
VTRRLLVACMLVLGASPAIAGDKIDPATQAKADVLFEKAQGNYQAGQFQAAIPLFQEAFDLVHDPVYLFNIAQSYRKVLDCENAFDFYTRYLNAATDADPKQREKVQGWLRELQPCVEQRQKEHDAVKHAEENERQRRAEELARQHAAQPSGFTEVDHGRNLRLAGLITGGVGVVGLGIGVLEAIHGRSLKNELADACRTNCDWSDPALQSKDSAGQRANTLSAIGLIGGGVAVLAGAGLYVWGRSKVETVQVTPSTTGATVSARLSF